MHLSAGFVTVACFAIVAVTICYLGLLTYWNSGGKK